MKPRPVIQLASLALLVMLLASGASATPTIPPPIGSLSQISPPSDQSDAANQPSSPPANPSSATLLPRSSQYDQYGGWNALPISNTSGYFRTAIVSGTAWLVTPDQHAFFSAGVDWVSFGNHPQVAETYDQRMFAKYRNASAWANATASQLGGWGINTIGAFSGSDITHHGLVESRYLNVGQLSMVSPYNTPAMNFRFPDVFAVGWAMTVTNIVSTEISSADVADPWLLGYFIDNELFWFNGYYVNQPTSSLSEGYIAQTRDEPGKQAWVNQLVGSYGTVSQLNAAWGTSYASFTGTEATSLLNTTSITATAAYTDKYQFLGQIANRYYSITTNAVRARDPHHLLLGDRYYVTPLFHEVVTAASHYLDVLSVNMYDPWTNPMGDDMQMEFLDELSAWGGKPVMVGEFSLLGVASGMPNVPLPAAHLVPTDRDRGSGYQLLMSEAARRPLMVGVHWFQHADRGLLNNPQPGWLLRPP